VEHLRIRGVDKDHEQMGRKRQAVREQDHQFVHSLVDQSIWAEGKGVESNGRISFAYPQWKLDDLVL
jgi:hypothetical protein